MYEYMYMYMHVYMYHLGLLLYCDPTRILLLIATDSAHFALHILRYRHMHGHDVHAYRSSLYSYMYV